MKDPSSKEQEIIVREFMAFCRKALEAERADYIREISRREKYEFPFSAAEELMNELCAYDHYSSENYTFKELEVSVEIENDLLAEALKCLAEDNREIILRYFFLDMKDAEIASLMHFKPDTVRKRRKRALHKLFDFMIKRNR